MDFKKECSGFVVDKKSKQFGILAGIDFMENTVSILTEDGSVTAKYENVLFLETIGKVGDKILIDHDVVESFDGRYFELELVNGGKEVQLYLLNKQLKRVKLSDLIEKERIHIIETIAKYIGNVYTLEPLKGVDFNIKIVRTKDDLVYYYACNNKVNEEIDLIKVVFVGNDLLPEEDYKRLTASYKEYLDMLKKNIITEVTPRELQKYVTDIMYGRKTVEPKAPEKAPEKCCGECEDCNGKCDCNCECDCEDNDTCPDCGKPWDNCDCEDW